MQQQRNLHMGTITMHVSAHVQVACCCTCGGSLLQLVLEVFFLVHIYTSGAIFPMLEQVVYIAYTLLCRWYMKHIYHFAKRPIFSVVFQ